MGRVDGPLSLMACYQPLKAYRPLSNLDGGRMVFDSSKALNPSNPVMVPCGGCIGCRLDRAGDWAMRCMHEAQMHPENCFITLTYDDKYLPEDYSVHIRTFQLFMKKLRKHYQPKKIRFYACGEYGPQTLRPHYHALLFNHDFTDKKLYKKNHQNEQLYSSPTLEKIWGYGFATIGDVTYQSAGYCAQYIMKKIGGERKLTHYSRTHPVNGLTVQVDPEFHLQSSRPGIGAAWFDEYKSDCFPSDFLVVDGRQHRVPAYYSKKLSEEELTKVKRRRKRQSLPQKPNNTRERLAVREEIKQSRINRLKRDL